jgi:6-pyruvoyl-tetrahydropterin synthase related domain
MVSTKQPLSEPSPADLEPQLLERFEAVAPDRPERAWYERVEWWIGIAVVIACSAYVLWQLEPRLLLRDTTTSGGDTGAHVWWPAYLRDHLLPWRLAGWSPDWYGGFPAGQFYFPLPALLVVALNLVMPYNVAFKLVTAMGPVALPIAAYSFARGIRAPRPAAPLFAVAATVFLFFKGSPRAQDAQSIAFNQHIMGGTLASNLAGEFSFTLALALALFFLGALAWALDHRRRLWLPAVLLAAVVMSHLVVAIFAVLAAIVIWLTRRGAIPNLRRFAAIGAVGVLLTAVWSVPLLATLGYTTDMRYEPIDHYVAYLFPGYLWWLLPFIAAAIIGGFVEWRRSTLAVGAITVLAGLLFRFWYQLPNSPAWNLRLVPFWYLGLFLLAALGATEIIRGVASFALRSVETQWWGPDDEDGEDGEDADTAVDGPGAGRTRIEDAGRSGLAAPPASPMVRAVTTAILVALLATVALVRVDQSRGFLPFWVKWNYTGYEDTTGKAQGVAKAWPEYQRIIATMSSLPPGRALWEPSAAIDKYGTTLALELLPYFTHGRIGSMEGLYFEASATTPYHFLTVATLTADGSASNPVRGLPYRTLADFNLGVRYLQLLGVRYYMAQSAATKQVAERSPSLRRVASVPDIDGIAPSGWNVYQVSDSQLVAPLEYQPVVMTDVQSGPSWKCEGSSRPPANVPSPDVFTPWECAAVPWFNDPSALNRPLTADGPSAWKRAPMTNAPRVPFGTRLPKVRVTKIHSDDHSVAFDVSRTGVPVLVKTSYFPNWQASGANGPWRATPNEMVVVPTSKHVRLVYGTTTAEWVGRIGTLLGLGGVAFLVWWVPGRRPRREVSPHGAGHPEG